MKINWKQKLSSRKLWAAASTIVSGICMLFGFAETNVEVISGTVLIIGGAIGYIVAEGVIDAKRAGETVQAIIDAINAVQSEIDGEKEVE